MPLTYALNAGNTSYSVTTGSCTAGAVSIPSTYNGLPVTGIINSAFTNCTTITSLSIPSSITLIQGFALSGCTSLTSITVDGSNPNYSSSDGILFNKTGTTLVSYPAGLSGSYTIGSGVTSIGDSAFFGCVNLTGITIGSNVSSIGANSFRSCAGLTSVNIPSSVITIGISAFLFCTNLAIITFNGSNLTTIGDFAFAQSGVSSIALPNSVSSLGASAFQQCSSLVTATLGTSLTSISTTLFYLCGNLSSITIPSNVTTLGNTAFGVCTNLSNVTFAGNQVTSIASQCFYQCSQLKSINLPTTLTTLNASVFGYSGLESITLPNSLVTMSSSVFFGCASLKNVYFGNGLISISVSTFNSCTSLDNVIIPETIQSIGNTAFFNCTNLKKVFLRRRTPPGLGTNVFGSPTTIYRRKNFTTGFGSTLGGRPVDIWSDNLIKSGGTGKLIGKKRPPYDPDATIYINNVEIADGQALEETTKNAINNFVVRCKSDNIWNSIQSSCILAGARTLNGALTPLKGPNLSNNAFITSDYSRSIGLKGNGTTKYLNTNYYFSSDQSEDIHAGVVFTERSSSIQSSALGVRNTFGSSTLAMIFTTSTSNLTFGLTSSVVGIGFGTAILENKLIGFKRDPSNGFPISYFGSNGAIDGSYGSSPSSVDTSNSVLVFATRSNSTGAITTLYNGRIFFYSVGRNIDLQKLNNRLNDLIAIYSSLT